MANQYTTKYVEIPKQENILQKNKYYDVYVDDIWVGSRRVTVCLKDMKPDECPFNPLLGCDCGINKKRV